MNQPANFPGHITADVAGIHQDHALQQAGLQHALHETADFSLRLLTAVALLRVHSLQPRTELNTALSQTGISLPERVNQAIGQDPCALCLAPSDWLLFSEYLTPELLDAQVHPAVDQRLTAVLDQSAALAILRLSGSTTAWLLSKCSGLDWRRIIASGQQCCRTRLDRLPVILHYHQPRSGSGPQVFDVIIDRSLVRQCWQMFLDRLPHACNLEQQHGPL